MCSALPGTPRWGASLSLSRAGEANSSDHSEIRSTAPSCSFFTWVIKLTEPTWCLP